jgi:anti-sigma regulatory factor (Ser/Thr protein kinase)
MLMLESRAQSRLPVDDASQVGECRRTAQRLAEACDFDATDVGRVGIVATELANNVVKHAGRGELLVQAIRIGSAFTIEMVAVDRGRGMHVESCMRDGYSTAGTAGTGLGAVFRMSTLFDAYSFIDRGSVVVSRVDQTVRAGANGSGAHDKAPEFGAICLALAGEIECGDIWRIAQRGGEAALMVADGLGHGALAASASRAAAAAFAQRPFDSPSECMQRLHGALAGSRGAAAACAMLTAERAKLAYAGVGNISATVIGADRPKGMVSHNGILGVQLLRKQQFDYDYNPGNRVIMHSDGMSARWSLGDYPGLLSHHAAVIAAVLYRDHARARDDVTVIVWGGNT